MSHDITLDIGRGESLLLPARKTLLGGLHVKHLFSKKEIHPYDEVNWVRRMAEIMDYKKGKPSFRRDVEVPESWSENSVKITAAKYLFGNEPETPQYEDSFRHAFDRIANTYTIWGWTNGYFDNLESAKAYNWELKAMLLKQIWAPNSPVWFNLGHWEQWRWGRPDLREIYKGRGNKAFKAVIGESGELEVQELDNNMVRPQASACFLTEIEDSMESILHHQVVEGRIFASGSGAGSNISSLRSSYEPIQGKGRSSGPLSFNKGWDRMAGAIKSGGKCLAPWQLVYTSEGPKKVSDLAKLPNGFTCLSYDPSLKRIVGKHACAWKQDAKNVVEITTDYNTYSLSVDHPVRSPDGRILQAGQLEEGDRLHTGHIIEKGDTKIWEAETVCVALKTALSAKAEGPWDRNARKRYQRLLASTKKKTAARERLLEDLDILVLKEYPMETFEDFCEGKRKVSKKKIDKKALLNKIKEAFGDFETMLDVWGTNESVCKIKSLGKMETYSVEVTCPSPDDKTAASGHNYLIWGSEDKVGSGIFVLNTRRAARMILMDSDHPNIFDFLHLKNDQEQIGKIVLQEHNSKVALKALAKEKTAQTKAEELAKKMIAAMPMVNEKTYDGSMDGEIYGETISDQNANHSISLLDEFWRSYWSNGDYSTRWVTNKAHIHETFPSKRLIREMAESAWANAEPGCHNNDWINLWNPVKAKGRITTSNPCCFVKDTPILTANEGVKTFGELTGRELDVYCRDPKSGRNMIRKMNNIGIKRRNAEIWKITFEDGGSLRCTHDEKFLDLNGNYQEACKLNPSQSLAVAVVRTDKDNNAIVTSFFPNEPAEKQVREVMNAEPDGFEDVYDGTVEDFHNFIAITSTHCETEGCMHLGVVAHNSEYLHMTGTSCLAGETMVTTDRGLERIDSLLERQNNGETIYVATELQSETNHNRMRALRPATVLLQGKKPVFLIETKDGRSIKATSDHRFLTETGWKRVDEMIPGKTKIQIGHLQNTPPKRPKDTEETKEWRLIGWISADGTFSKGHISINFAGEKQSYIPEAKETLEKLIKKASEKYGDPMGSKPTNPEGSWAEDGQFNINCSRQSLVQYLEEEFGLKQGTGTEKSIPEKLWTEKSENQIAFLQALFGGDGCLLTHPDAEEKEIMLATSSPEMATGVQAILALYGITSRITWCTPEGRKNPQAQIHIRNQQQRRFASLVGFKCNPPKEREIQEILEKEELQREHTPRNPSVVAITPIGTEETYDISEPETHSFIANGFISHNCNLSSFNIFRFLKADGTIDTEALRHGARIAMIAADLNIEECGFPDPSIALGTYAYRTTGIGYGNIGGLLMAMGIPYDSDEGRYLAGLLVSHLSAYCWAASAEMGRELGAYKEHESTCHNLAEVLRLHRACHTLLQGVPDTGDEEKTFSQIIENEGPLPQWGTLNGHSALKALQNSFASAQKDWDPARLKAAEKLAQTNPWNEIGFETKESPYLPMRNSFTTLMAPGGTISGPLGIYDEGTTSIEPDYTLVKYKSLSGGGTMTMFNSIALKGLRTLGYTEWQIKEAALEVAGINGLLIACDGKIQEAAAHLADGCRGTSQGPVRSAFCETAIPADTSILDLVVAISEGKKTELDYLVTNGSANVEGIPWLPDHHKEVFDCAATLGGGTRSIAAAGHIRMLGAIQPFLSGSSSKTVNLPYTATVEDIIKSFEMSHQLGVKCIALYRADSKGVSVYSSDSPDAEKWKAEAMYRKICEEIESGVLDIQKEASKPRRRKLPGRREASVIKFEIPGQQEGFLIVGLYPDGRCGEIFGRLGQGGSFGHGMFEAFCKAFSVMLQWGVPLPNAINTFKNMAFDPAGWVKVGDPAEEVDVKSCRSVVDLMMRILEWLFPEDNQFRIRDRSNQTLETEEGFAHEYHEEDIAQEKAKVARSAAEECPNCGALALIPDGKCKRCTSCGWTGGGCGA